METPKKTEKEKVTKARAEKRIRLSLPQYSLGEEIFSSVTHGISALFAVAAYVILLVFCRKDSTTLWAVNIYGITMILLYTVSTIYHALGLNTAKKVFRTLDHCTIFLLIAGTYAPITLISLRGMKGWVMFWVVLLSALGGIILNSISVKRFSKISMVFYLAMGWVIVFAMGDFYESAGFYAVVFLGIGGVFYCVGAVLYVLGKKVAYMHPVWHIFVLFGSFFHFLTVYQIVVP